VHHRLAAELVLGERQAVRHGGGMEITQNNGYRWEDSLQRKPQ